MKITIDPSEPAIFPREVFDPAIENAIKFLMRAETKEAVARNISDFSSERYEEALLEDYSIKIIQQKGEIIGFSCVYPTDEPNSVFFNPILLVNMTRMLNNFPPQAAGEIHFLLSLR